MQLKNVSPLGDLTIPGVGRVKAGDKFTATGDLAEGLLNQPSNFERVDKPKHHTKGDEEKQA